MPDVCVCLGSLLCGVDYRLSPEWWFIIYISLKHFHFSYVTCDTADIHVQIINVDAICAVCHDVKLTVRCSHLSRLTVSVQFSARGAVCWLTCLLFTVQRRSGVTASGGCRWARRGTPYSGWRRALHTPRTGGTHLALMKWLSWLSACTKGIKLDSKQDVWMNLNAQSIKNSVEFAVSCHVTAKPCCVDPVWADL